MAPAPHGGTWGISVTVVEAASTGAASTAGMLEDGNEGGDASSLEGSPLGCPRLSAGCAQAVAVCSTNEPIVTNIRE